jgi:hypothetical protein
MDINLLAAVTALILINSTHIPILPVRVLFQIIITTCQVRSLPRLSLQAGDHANL